MPISGSQKALMYAIGGVARGGATRGGYHSPKVFLTIGGIHYATGRPTDAQKVLYGSLTVQKTNGRPHTASFRTKGFIPTVGQDVVIQLGSKNTLRRVIAGQIISVDEGYVGTPGNFEHLVSVIDYTWGINALRVTGRYTGSATTIAKSLISEFAPGYTSNGVTSGLATVTDGITFTEQTVWEALTQLASRIGAYWYIDYYKDLRFFVTDTSVTAPRQLTPTLATLKPGLRTSRSIGSMVTRVNVEGGGGKSLAAVVAGETIIPVDAPEWYVAVGGKVKSGPQYISYTGVIAAGGGGLVGTGASPSNPPTLALAAGSNLGLGEYDYAVTFVTGSGESLPSQVASITIGFNAPSTAAVAGSPTAGGNVAESTDINYKVSFVNDVGETTPSPVSNTVSTVNLTAPTAAVSSIATYNPGPIPQANHWFVYTFTNATGETTMSPATQVDTTGTTPGSTFRYRVSVPTGPSGTVTRRVFRTVNFAGMGVPVRTDYRLVGTIPDNTEVYFWDSTTDGGLGSENPPATTTATFRTVPLTGIPLGPAGTTGRRIYRRKADALYYLVDTIPNNTAMTYSDTKADADLGGSTLAVSTAEGRHVALSGIPIGSSSVTSRKLYRTTAGGAQLKLVTTIADNTTTTYTDSAMDGSLGANVPTSDASGLTQPAGQVLPGATSVPVAGLSAFSSSGGWAAIGNGQQVIRYTGKSSTALTGVPAAGAGAITAAISYNSTVTVPGQLTGIPASGTGAIKNDILQGDDVNLWVTINDTTAQARLAAYTGGTGIVEDVIQDRRLSYEECVARGTAHLNLLSPIEETVRYQSHDLNAHHVGQMISMNLVDPSVINREFRIQQVTLSNFQPSIFPICDVTAASQLFSFEDLLQLARKAVA